MQQIFLLHPVVHAFTVINGIQLSYACMLYTRLLSCSSNTDSQSDSHIP